MDRNQNVVMKYCGNKELQAKRDEGLVQRLKFITKIDHLKYKGKSDLTIHMLENWIDENIEKLTDNYNNSKHQC